jgi:16S rRNA (guanine527-N7)-methyltransferase
LEKLKFLENALKSINCETDNDKTEQILRFYEMLIEKNKVMNLTAITDFEEFVNKHIIDSLSVSKIMNLKDKSLKVIDVGTGAGFPGIPLKIMYPTLDITLFDSLKKRLKFLDEVIEELKLKDIRSLHGRAEEFGRKDEYREKFDLVVSRAVADLTPLCELTLPFTKVKGSFIAYKGSKGELELQAADKCIKILGGKVVNKIELKIDDSSRLLIKIDKIRNTDVKYPRGGGKVFRAPLYID